MSQYICISHPTTVVYSSSLVIIFPGNEGHVVSYACMRVLQYIPMDSSDRGALGGEVH